VLPCLDRVQRLLGVVQRRRLDHHRVHRGLRELLAGIGPVIRASRRDLKLLSRAIEVGLHDVGQRDNPRARKLREERRDPIAAIAAANHADFNIGIGLRPEDCAGL